MSALTDVAKAKQKLIASAKRNGYLVENWGDKEIRELSDRYGALNYVVCAFHMWCYDFDLTQLEEA